MGGYISVENVGRLNKVLCKVKQYDHWFSANFSRTFGTVWRVVCINHCLFHLLGKDNLQLENVFATQKTFF